MRPDDIFKHMVDEGDHVLDVFDRCVRELPNKTFIHYGEDNIRLTFRELKDRTDRLAAGLINLGVKPGDMVSVYSRNALLSAESMFAIWRAGAVYAPINFFYTGRLLAYQVSDTKPRVIITDFASMSFFNSIADEVELPHFVIHRPVSGQKDYNPDIDALGVTKIKESTILSDIMSHTAIVEKILSKTSDPANLIYTSGTTGPAKGVLLPFRWINQYTFYLRQLMGGDDIIYNDLPLYHIGGAHFNLTRAVWRGNTVSLWDRFSPTQFWDRICGSGSTSCTWADVMVPWLMKEPQSARDRENPLRHVYMQPLPLNHNEVARRFGIDFVSVGFGQTETGLGYWGLIDELEEAEGTPPEIYRGLSREATRAAAERFGIKCVSGKTRLAKGFMGNPSPLFETAVLDDEDNVCAEGQVGQLAFRPRFPFLAMKEYHNKLGATWAASRNLWFHTGDAARVDNDGSVLFVDRMGGFFRVRGENVSSYQVEDLMNTHPMIRACAAVPIPAREGDEDEIAVFVEAAPDVELTVDDLVRHADEVMPKFMRPSFIRILDALPLTPTSKVEKYKLRNQIMREIGMID